MVSVVLDLAGQAPLSAVNAFFVRLEAIVQHLGYRVGIEENSLADSLPLDMLEILPKQKLTHLVVTISGRTPVFYDYIALRQGTTQRNGHHDLVDVKLMQIILVVPD